MINDECKAEVTKFLEAHKSPSVRIATTMKDGYVTCISPIPTICGAELMCSPKTERHLRDLMRSV